MVKLKRIKKKIDNLEKGWKGTLISFIVAFLLAYLIHRGLAFALSTPEAAVIIYSSSMQHDNPEVTYYGWLKEKLNYSREFIDSWPFPNGLYIGDIAFLQGQKEYKVGDVIVYSAKNYPLPIIHRIIKINEDGTYQTKGDNNPIQIVSPQINEKYITSDQIIGKAIGRIRFAGYLKVFVFDILKKLK